MSPKTLIVIAGPTASGKSALAIDLALKLDTGIVSADSRQIYRAMPIVTAVTPPEERMGVAHHLLECLEIDARYSASSFEQDALEVIGEMFRAHDAAIVCGGSMMYIDALCNGIDNLPTIPEDLRRQIRERHEMLGDEWVRGELRRVDPASSARVDPLNMRRVIHALEITLAAGRPASELLVRKSAERPFRILKFALNGPREWLFNRINRRVDTMVAAGLEEEARRLYPHRALNALNTVGLKEMFQYFDGKMTRSDAIERIKKNTRVYAKKQLTWLRRDPSIHWLDATHPLHELVEEILRELKGKETRELDG